MVNYCPLVRPQPQFAVQLAVQLPPLIAGRAFHAIIRPQCAGAVGQHGISLNNTTALWGMLTLAPERLGVRLVGISIFPLNIAPGNADLSTGPADARLLRFDVDAKPL
jgi:hypothetical protein